jgi:pre-mRNA-processing factor 40
MQERLRRKECKNWDEFRRLMEDHKATSLLTTKTHWPDYCEKVLIMFGFCFEYLS